MTFRFVASLLALICLAQAQAQNLYSQEIKKLQNAPGVNIFEKNSIFYHQGVGSSQLTKMRNRYSAARERERLVLDFSTVEPPQVYGYVDISGQKLYLSLFNTNMPKSYSTPEKGHFVEEIKFFLMQKDFVNVEISFKRSVHFDIFHLSNPGRIVVDIMR